MPSQPVLIFVTAEDYKTSDIVEVLHARIRANEGISSDQPTFIFAFNQRLENNRTLADYSVQPEHVVHLVPILHCELQILVKTGVYDIVTIGCERSDTIKAVKRVRMLSQRSDSLFI